MIYPGQVYDLLNYDFIDTNTDFKKTNEFKDIGKRVKNKKYTPKKYL